MNFFIRLLISGVITYVLAKILSGVHIDHFGTAVIFALVLAFLNAIVKPILIVLTLPVTVVTIGLFLFVINAIIILLADWMISGIKVDGFWWALLFSIILSLFSSAVQKVTVKDTESPKSRF
ncbi:MAG: phage holin family protein [Ferruginibacter sp.]